MITNCTLYSLSFFQKKLDDRYIDVPWLHVWQRKCKMLIAVIYTQFMYRHSTLYLTGVMQELRVFDTVGNVIYNKGL